MHRQNRPSLPGSEGYPGHRFHEFRILFKLDQFFYLLDIPAALYLLLVRTAPSNRLPCVWLHRSTTKIRSLNERSMTIHRIQQRIFEVFGKSEPHASGFRALEELTSAALFLKFLSDGHDLANSMRLELPSSCLGHLYLSKDHRAALTAT